MFIEASSIGTHKNTSDSTLTVRLDDLKDSNSLYVLLDIAVLELFSVRAIIILNRLIKILFANLDLSCQPIMDDCVLLFIVFSANQHLRYLNKYLVYVCCRMIECELKTYP